MVAKISMGFSTLLHFLYSPGGVVGCGCNGDGCVAGICTGCDRYIVKSQHHSIDWYFLPTFTKFPDVTIDRIRY